MGSATVQGRLWGTAPHDWAQVIEPLMVPIHSVTLAELAPLTGLSLLDAGCGSGLALQLAADQGARVSGWTPRLRCLMWPAGGCPMRTCG